MNKQFGTQFLRTVLLALALLCVAPTEEQQKKKVQKKTVVSQKNSKKKTTKNKAIPKKKIAKKTNSKTKKPLPKTAKKPTVASIQEIKAKALQSSQAEQDSNKVVVVYAAFKPNLEAVAKVNFNATMPIGDTIKERLLYNFPAQRLTYSFNPVTIKPLALSIDTQYYWQNKGYLRLGGGNFSTISGDLGLSIGNGKDSNLQVFASHLSGKGKLPYQQYSKNELVITGNLTNQQKQNWVGKLYFQQQNQFLYGYKPDTLSFEKDQLKQNFHTYGASIALQNVYFKNLNLLFNPTLNLVYFGDNKHTAEYHIAGIAPFSRRISKMLNVEAKLSGSIDRIQTPLKAINNNWIELNPNIQFLTPNTKAQLGFKAGMLNTQLYLQPQLYFETKLIESFLSGYIGWAGSVKSNSYQSLARYNPWIEAPNFMTNTRIDALKLGIKGSLHSYITYNGYIARNVYKDLPIFINNKTDGKSFEMLNMQRMVAYQLHGELGYTIGERFVFLGAADAYKYTNMEGAPQAYGLLPIQLTGSLQWTALPELRLKADLFCWTGPYYQTQGGASLHNKNAIDLNLFGEYSLNKQWLVWAQLSNIFNDTYQRWNQYPVLGLNVFGGIKYNFKVY